MMTQTNDQFTRPTVAVVCGYGEIFLLRHRLLGENFRQVVVIFKHDVYNTHMAILHSKAE